MLNPSPASPTAWKDSVQLGLKIYLPLRFGLSIFVALLIGLVPGLALPPRTELMARWGIPVPTGYLADLFLNPWLRFDALWYLKIALNGYGLSEPNVHHLPLYPVLIRLAHEIIGGHITLSALLVSNLAFILALSYVYRLVRLDETGSIARRTVIYLAIFPTAFFYLAGYTESLFLLGSVSSFYYARQRAWFKAGLLGSISALTRPQGVLILVPLLWEFFRGPQADDARPDRWPRAWPLLLIPSGVALYALYLQLTFGLSTILTADTAYWQMQTGQNFPGYALWLNVSAIGQGIHPLNNSIDLAFALFGLAMTGWAILTLRPSYALFMLLNMLVVISRPIIDYPLLSMPRFVLPLFPMYILLGRAGEASPLINRLVVYSWLALLMFFSAQFALGGWVA
jgi:hypothetical protein